MFLQLFIGPTQTGMDYKLDPLFTPAYVPFPSLVQEMTGEKVLSGNEGVEVPTRSLFCILWY